jgi:predicted ribosome quality control (RQC) complex YloA/Tae2 family protein
MLAPWVRCPVQPVDFTTLAALCQDLRTKSLPARLEQVVQPDRFTVCLALRSFTGRQWLTLCWHPQAARLSMTSPPPRQPDTFTFNQQLVHQLGGLALVGLEFVAPWERAVVLQFAQRPGDPVLWHLYVEIMGQYSNVILTNQNNIIVTAAHQVSDRQSSVRPIQTGDRYVLPPGQGLAAPSVTEPLERWRSRISLIPGPIGKNLRQPYQGVSTALATELVSAAGIAPDRATDSLTASEWAALFDKWQIWMAALAGGRFHPHPTATGYSVIDWAPADLPTDLPTDQPADQPADQPTDQPTDQPADQPSAPSVQALVDGYYADQLHTLNFSQLHHRLLQQVTNSLKKLTVKRQGFDQRLGQADRADTSRQQADLLMAHLHQWSPGLTVLDLPDFETGAPVRITLSPDQTAIQTTQALYKRHKKLKRTRAAVDPLRATVQA